MSRSAITLTRWTPGTPQSSRSKIVEYLTTTVREFAVRNRDTLSDNKTLAEDELENVEMVESEQTKKRNSLKTKSRVYTGFDDDEFLLAPRTERSVLAKYDEDIEPLQKKVFRLGSGDTDSATGRAVQTGGSISDSAMVDKSLLLIDHASE